MKRIGVNCGSSFGHSTRYLESALDLAELLVVRAYGLTNLSPLKVLDRGYAIVRKPSGEVVKDPVEAPAGTDLRIRQAQGELTAKVTDSKQ